MLFLILLFVFSLVYVWMPWNIALSWRIGAVDVPADPRRMHSKKIPRGGGLGIFLGLALGVWLLGIKSHYVTVVLWGSGLMLAVGLIDDIFCLRATVKLLFQWVISMGVVLGSGGFDSYGKIAFAVFWMVLLTNAHNFIDGMDGLLAGCAAGESIFLGVILLLCGVGGLWQCALILAVALLSFRMYNRYPAEVFAGDCGSGFVGFLLGALSLPLFSMPILSFFNLVPCFLFAYPITELVSSVLRRLLCLRSPFAADRAHFHHRLYARGLEHPDCVTLLTCVSLSLGGIAVLLCERALWSYAVVAALGTVLLLWYLRRSLEA